MGRKIPPANDGSNYYQARKGNRIEGVSFNDAIFDECVDWPQPEPRGIKGTHWLALTSNNYNWTPQNGVINISSSSISSTVSFPTTTTSGYLTTGGGYARTTVAAPNSNPSFTFTTQSTFVLQDDFLIGGDLSIEDRMRLQQEYELVPDHVFKPNLYGQCEDCPHHNMYRRDENSHVFLIQETPDLEDWWEQLAS